MEKEKKMMMKKTKDDFCYICVTSLWSRLCIQTEKREDVYYGDNFRKKEKGKK